MFTTYDKAVTKMIQYLKQKEVCSSSIKSHIDCYERYKAYFLKEDSQWSDESVSSWLLTIKGTVNGALYYTSCNYIWQLSELSSTGCILDRHLYLTISSYEKLSVFQFQAELDDFLNQYVSHYTKRSLELAKNATAECLLFFVDRGCQSTRELSYTDMDALRAYPFFSSSKRRAACIGHLRRFLEFMSEKGDCSPLLSAYLDDSYGTYVGKLSGFSRQSQLLIDEHTHTEDSIPVEKLVLPLCEASHNGKTYMACAFGMEACKQYFNTKYVRLPDLLIDLGISRLEGNYKKVMAKYANPVVLILNEWLLLKPLETEQRDIFELLHRRKKKSTTIICSQYEFEEWYDQLGGDASPLADAIIVRIAHDSYRINITSIDDAHDISMREVYGLGKNLRE